MAKQPRLTAGQAERLLLDAGFTFLRQKGSHRVGTERQVIPSHAGRTLHPKIVRQVLNAIGGN